MPSGNETVDDSVHDVAVRREKFAAGRGNFDADLVVRRNKRAPGADEIGLAGYGENKPVDHAAHHDRIGLVLSERGGIVSREDDGLPGDHLRLEGGAHEKTG